MTMTTARDMVAVDTTPTHPAFAILCTARSIMLTVKGGQPVHNTSTQSEQSSPGSVPMVPLLQPL